MSKRADGLMPTLSCIGIAAFTAVIVGCVGYALFWHKPIRPPSPTQVLEDMAAGDWEDVAGDATLSLDRKTHKAVIKIQEQGAKEVQSTGTWSASASTIAVDVNGAAGMFSLKLELVEGSSVLFLTPSPPNTALLKDCWLQVVEPEPYTPDDPY